LCEENSKFTDGSERSVNKLIIDKKKSLVDVWILRNAQNTISDPLHFPVRKFVKILTI